MNGAVLIVEDDRDLREALCDTLNLAGFNTVAAEHGVAAIPLLKNKYFNIVVSDVAMKEMDGYALLKMINNKYPELPVLLMTAFADINQAVKAIRGGAVDYLAKPFEPKLLIDKIKHFMRVNSMSTNKEIVIVDQKSKEMFHVADQVSRSEVSVLITGESGTGKEVLARYIHNHSSRHNGPFIALNCAAIPDNMLEAMLFGYEKGAFTGAHQLTIGKFEQAQKGTILLDEITEMDIGLQAKLLRVLQEREIERLGGRKTIKLDIRVLATTNRNITDEVNNNRFREDLYYRLNVFPIYSFSLRDRKNDIVPLAENIIASAGNGRKNVILDASAKEKLMNYSWPGNIRELDNVIQRSLILQSKGNISDKELIFNVSENKNKNRDDLNSDSLESDLKKHEFKLILEVLNKNKGCRKLTAKQLDISVRTLRYKLAQMRELNMFVPEAMK